VAKPRTVYKCQVCGYQSPKWLGKCPECASWNSFVEVVETPEDPHGSKSIQSPENLGVASLEFLIDKSKNQPEKRLYPFAFGELNKFWGGGLVAGSLTLLAGEPGLGKSTLALQLLRSLWLGQGSGGSRETPPSSTSLREKLPNSVSPNTASAASNFKLLYVTAEESVMELARRSQRLQIPKQILVMQSNNLEQIERALDREKPQVVIIDSIQTIYASEISGSPGSVSQVSSLASQFLAISKSRNISLVLIGHVTKEGQIAGPKTLEHLVDSVVLLESTKASGYRTLSFSKHRFGTTEGLLLMKMEENGLQIVADPSLALLENLETGVGVVYGLAMDKDLPLVVEIQALVSKTYGGEGGYGHREAIGLTGAKLNTILAIAEKYLSLSLKSSDVFVQLTGLPKSVVDHSLDLPILLAILSSAYNKPIGEIIHKPAKDPRKREAKPKGAKLAFAGRLTLSGKVRQATNQETRQNTAQKLGFSFNPGISLGDLEGVLPYSN
jgi:DNA repair protein RadA/Sms